MDNGVIIENNLQYLLIQQLGWDYNFWSVIFANIILCVAFFGIIFLIGLVGILLNWW